MRHDGELGATLSSAPRRSSAALLAACVSLSGCGFGTSLEEALSTGAEETEEVTRSRQNPDFPVGQMLFYATWYEDPEVTASEINAEVMDALRAAEAEVTCQEVPPRPGSGSQVPGQDCAFTWSDGRKGAYVVEGGGLPAEDVEVDGIAINLSAEYPER